MTSPKSPRALCRIKRACDHSAHVANVLALTIFALTVLGCSSMAQDRAAPISAMFPEREPFLAALERERPKHPIDLKVSGIAVPHHLLAADLIARGFWTVAGGTYDRVIVVSPDHFSRSRRPFATTSRDIDTAFGTLSNDKTATTTLLGNPELFDDNDLFAEEHGVAALLPFVKHFFPTARIMPVVVAYTTTRLDWDRAIEALAPLVTPTTLVVQSTDYSHYLPQATAVKRDQETLNIIAAGDTEGISRLVQPDHMDSKGSQYIQMRLQALRTSARPVIIASRSSTEYSVIGGMRTTSYLVTIYTETPGGGARLRYDDHDVIYFGGDTLIGRFLTRPLSDPAVSALVIDTVRRETGGAPLVLNLEGVLLDEPPANTGSAHVMHAGLAVPLLKALNVKAVSLANNHSHDLGRDGLRESIAVLKRSGIPALGHMQAADLGRFGLVAINFIGVRDYRNYPVVRGVEEIGALCRLKARAPLVALVHWGEEYTNAALPADYAMADALHACGASLVIGVHSHQATARIEQRQGGEYQMVFSIGNFLFDQRSDRASGALLELRVFKQGTFATRLIPIPNLYELASRSWP